jgi:hypothetical protein
MLNYNAILSMIPCKPYAKPPAKLTGGDMIDYGKYYENYNWLELTVLNNPTYKSSSKSVTACGEIEK